VLVIHVEPGLMNYDLFEPFAEEVMHQMTLRIINLYFALTHMALDALANEGIVAETTISTNNTVIDALS
jgi:UDP-N-acetylglucosamine 2-epimerase